MRTTAMVVALAGVALVVASFFLPRDFEWNGLASFMFCLDTSRYASGIGARLVWLGFAAAVLYPFLWAVAAGVAVSLEWRRMSGAAPYVPAFVTTAGSLLLSAIGFSLILMGETWPAPSAQWSAGLGALAHAGILWIVVRHASPARRTAAAILTGGIPFVGIAAALGVSSWRYGNPVWSFGLATTGLLTMVTASAILFAGTERRKNDQTEVDR